MKRLLALLLTLSMVFALAACTLPEPPEGGDDCTVHVDEDSNGLCDACGETVDIPPVTGDGDGEGLKLSNALIAQFEAMKSFEVTFEVANVITENEWYMDESGEVLDSYLEDMKAEINFFIAKTANGINFKGEATMMYRSSIEDEYVSNALETIYFIDGTLYTYDDDLHAYVADNAIDLDGITEVLENLPLDSLLSEDEREEMLGLLGDSLIKTFNIKDYRGSLELDLTEKANEVISYFANLDLENDTLRDVIDHTLKIYDEELTSEKLLAEFDRFSALTVNEALGEIDAWLTENYDTTLQGLYDKIVNDERMATVVELFAKADAQPELDGDGEDLTIPEEGNDTEAILAELRAFKLADYIAENELGDVVVYDLIASMIGEDAPAKDDLFAMVDQIIDTPIAEAEEQMGNYIFTELQYTFSGVTVNELYAKLDLNFKGIFEIESIDFTFKTDIKVERSSEIEGKNDVYTVKIDAKATINEISTDEINITLPDGAKVLPNIFDDFYEGNVCFYFVPTDDTLSFHGEYYDYYDEELGYITIRIEAYNLPLSIIGDGIITVPKENVRILWGDIVENIELDSDFVIGFEGDMLYIISMPDNIFPESPEQGEDYLGEWDADC